MFVLIGCPSKDTCVARKIALGKQSNTFETYRVRFDDEKSVSTVVVVHRVWRRAVEFFEIKRDEKFNRHGRDNGCGYDQPIF